VNGLHDPLAHVADVIHTRVPAPSAPALLVALSGIDGSGKSTLARELVQRLERDGLRVAGVGVDPWQHPQTVRFGGPDRGLHFYRHAVRFDAMFAELVTPLVRDRGIDLEIAGIRSDRDIYEPLAYHYGAVDVVLLEGIFLLQPAFDARFDLRVWIDCSFETALERALHRNAEDRPLDALRDDYEFVYHAAQRHHIACDRPRDRADVLIDNERSLH
jgi:uridine kinase